MGGQQINPVTPNPIIGVQTQRDLFNALFGAVGFGLNDQQYGKLDPLKGYPGQLSPDINSTMLPGVYNSWQPWDSGMAAISEMLYGNKGLKPGEASPYSQQLMQWGGTGGPGHSAMNNAAQWGTPSPNLPYLGSLAQWGTTGQAGKPLQDLAQGYATGAASWMLPWLQAPQQGQRYKAPEVKVQPVTRKG